MKMRENRMFQLVLSKIVVWASLSQCTQNNSNILQGLQAHVTTLGPNGGGQNYKDLYETL